MSSRVEDLRRKLESLQQVGEQAAQKTPDFNQMREQLNALQTSATSADRAVTVTAGPNGAIQNIQFTQDALRGSPSQLSSTVMSTLQQAIAEAARKQAEIVQEHTGDGEVLNRVLRTQEEMLGTKVEPPESQSSRSSGESVDYDDDYDNDSFYDRRGY